MGLMVERPTLAMNLHALNEKVRVCREEVPLEVPDILEVDDDLKEQILFALSAMGGQLEEPRELDMRAFLHRKKHIPPIFLVGKTGDIVALDARDAVTGELVRVRPFDDGMTVSLNESGRNKCAVFFGRNSAISIFEIYQDGERQFERIGWFPPGDETPREGTPACGILLLGLGVGPEIQPIHALNVYLPLAPAAE